MKNRQSDKELTKQVRIDAGLHTEVKIIAAKEKKSIKELVEECLYEYLSIKIVNPV